MISESFLRDFFNVTKPVEKGTDWKAVADHYKALWEREDKSANFHKALLYDAYRTMAGQTRGLQRQSRRIKRLKAEVARLRSCFAGSASAEPK